MPTSMRPQSTAETRNSGASPDAAPKNGRPTLDLGVEFGVDLGVDLGVDGAGWVSTSTSMSRDLERCSRT